MHRSAFVIPLIAASALFAQGAHSQNTDQAISAQVAEAEAAIVKSDWKAASATLTPWLAAHPEDGRALFDAGFAADELNQLDEATGFYRRAVAANPHSFEAHVSLGLLLARQEKFAEARTELAAATALDPGLAGAEAKAHAWRALAKIDSASDATAASVDLIEALKLSPETPADTLLAADLAAKTGQLDAAEKAYRRVLASDPKSAQANAGLAHLLIARKEYPEAESLLRKALEQSPTDAALTAQLAVVLTDEDKPEALPLLQKLHETHPDNAAITHMLAEVLAETGDAAGSDRCYTELLKASPNDPALLVAHGQNLTRQFKYAEAYAAFDKATQLDASNADGWSGLAFAASRTAQPKVTLRALGMRAKYLPENSSTYFLWAISYDTIHNTAEAVAFYHRFLESSAGKLPNQEWQAMQRLLLLSK